MNDPYRTSLFFKLLPGLVGRFIALAWLWVLGLAVPLLGLGQNPRFPQPQGLVSDYAGVLQPQERQRLEAYLRLFRDSTSNEIAVAIFPAVPDGEVLDDYVNRLYEAWGIGQAKQNNGVLVALFVQDRKARIEVGYGLEAVIPDAAAAQIYREQMRPAFQRQQYFAGLAAGVQSLAQRAAQEFKTPLTRRRSQERKPGDVVAALLIVLVILAIGYWIYRNSGGGGGPRGGRRYRRGWDGPGILFLPTGWGGGYGGGGFGGGGGGLGDFGGFGGGLSGGGGASGDW